MASVSGSIVAVDSDVIPIWVVEFQVSTHVELAGEQRGDKWDVDIGEEVKVLAGEGVGQRGGVGEDKAEAESRDRREDGEDEGVGEGGDRGRVRGEFSENFCWVEDAAYGKLVGVICEANGGVESGVVDESEVGGNGDVGEGIEEEIKSRSAKRKRLLKRMMKTVEKDGWGDGASI
ncbi:unnamed protein product [Malus baccata var. baccata]